MRCMNHKRNSTNSCHGVINAIFFLCQTSRIKVWSCLPHSFHSCGPRFGFSGIRPTVVDFQTIELFPPCIEALLWSSLLPLFWSYILAFSSFIWSLLNLLLMNEIGCLEGWGLVWSYELKDSIKLLRTLVRWVLQFTVKNCIIWTIFFFLAMLIASIQFEACRNWCMESLRSSSLSKFSVIVNGLSALAVSRK